MPFKSTINDADFRVIYDNLLIAYRRNRHATHKQAADEAGCRPDQSRKLFTMGDKMRGWRAIKDVIQEEDISARAHRAVEFLPEELRKLLPKEVTDAAENDLASKVAQAERELEGLKAAKLRAADEKAREILADAEHQAQARLEQVEGEARKKMGELLEKAHLDAVETMADEASISKLARRNAKAVLTMTALIFQSATNLQQQIQTAMASGQLTPGQVMNLILSIARLSQRANHGAQLALELERLRVGQPTEIIEVKGDVSIEQVEDKARRLLEARERIRAAQMGNVRPVGEAIADGETEVPAPTLN